MVKEDTKKETALKILKDVLNITPVEVTRFPTGFCHSVYFVKTETEEYVLRVTESKRHYDGSVKWLNELVKLDIPIPKVLSNGQYGDVYYTLITYINGKDIGSIYHTLNDFQKRHIVKELVEIQKKVSALPPNLIYGFENYPPVGSIVSIKNHIRRIRENITANKVFDPGICDVVADFADKFEDYFASINPVLFLDDIQTKNVLVNNGKLAGIVDIDEMGYGDPLVVVGVTHMSLLLMEADIKYIDYWLDEMQASDVQRKMLKFYTLLYCIDFMGERGAKFNNDVTVPVNQMEVDLLNSIYNNLLCDLL